MIAHDVIGVLMALGVFGLVWAAISIVVGFFAWVLRCAENPGTDANMHRNKGRVW